MNKTLRNMLLAGSMMTLIASGSPEATINYADRKRSFYWGNCF